MNTKEYVEKYMEVYVEVREFFQNFVNIDIIVAISNKIFEEMLKDIRSAQIESGKTVRTGIIHDTQWATQKQKYLMTERGIAFGEHTTKKDASQLIEESLKRQNKSEVKT